ncbi:MAG: hypothetical protein V4540_01295 [Pseudomonadota bacterium]
MHYTFIYRRFPSALFQMLVRLARRNGCSVHEQARRVLIRQLDPLPGSARGTRTRRHAA